jgi:hypothetical protein
MGALGFSAAAAAAAAGSGSCVEELLRAVTYKQVQATADGTNNFAIDTPPVTDGRYWVVFAAAGVRLNGGGAGNAFGGLFLMRPDAVGAPAPAAAALSDFEGVQIDAPSTVSGGTISGGANSVSIDRKIIVPPKWFLRFMSTGTPVPGAGGVYALRLAYAELPLTFDALDVVG